MKSSDLIKQININEIENFKIGSAQNYDAMTGVTVIICEKGGSAGVDISGGGPASRETPLLSPITADNPIHAVVLSGGSAFGLAASDGIMQWLEQHGIGYHTKHCIVPLVVQSCLFDLAFGKSDVRPDAEMGRAACENALLNHPVSGSIGAGTGATVGKLRGIEHADKSGLGVYAVQIGDLKIGAVVALNALGDIFDFETGEKIAGMRNDDGSFGDSASYMYQIQAGTDLFNGNTTIACILTNGDFTCAQMNKIASMARSGFSRAIRPVGTMADGDSIYAISCGNVKADINAVGTASAQVLSAAIKEAIMNSDTTLNTKSF